MQERYQLSGAVLVNGDINIPAYLGGSVAQADRLDRVDPKVGGRLALELYSSNKPGELS